MCNFREKVYARLSAAAGDLLQRLEKEASAEIPALRALLTEQLAVREGCGGVGGAGQAQVEDRFSLLPLRQFELNLLFLKE